MTPAGPLAQATNYADVRIHGVELSADAPLAFGRGVLTLARLGAFMRGTITEGINPLDGERARRHAGGQHHAVEDPRRRRGSPSRAAAGGRSTASGRRPRSRAWRQTLLDSPFLIAQDLLSLDGFTVQRLGWGVNLARGRDRVGLSFAVENLTDAYYREHFQFAPARGRSFTVGLNLGAF